MATSHIYVNMAYNNAVKGNLVVYCALESSAEEILCSLISLAYKRKQKEVYKWKNNSIYFKIKSIEKYESDSPYCYCFQMDDEDEPYFTLPNGLITHNCRLVSDVKNLG